MGELTKRIYFGGRFAKKRWANYKKLAMLYFKGSVAALIRDALTKTYHLDPETGEALNDVVADKPQEPAPNLNKKSGSTGVASSNKSNY